MCVAQWCKCLVYVSSVLDPLQCSLWGLSNHISNADTTVNKTVLSVSLNNTVDKNIFKILIKKKKKRKLSFFIYLKMYLTI